VDQQSDTGSTAALALSAPSPDVNPDRTPENLSIFSAPALEVVFHWWLESNRRWTARDVRSAAFPPWFRPTLHLS
jgi:hypothetical protein